MAQPSLLTHDLGGRRVLDGVTLTASPGRRVGRIGENGVGLTGVGRDRTLGQPSGGQRGRLALAALLDAARTVRRPPALLLDEPTDHPSPGLCGELEEALGSGPGAIVVAGHGRWLRRRRQGCGFRLEAGA
ncbi:hypothetical protein ACH4KU_25735 [Streptomyces althioticus]|uniref:hypothetical protein n=1 Tax=Streptomyces althioticus TaxID=83380 RepID=UPI0036A95947